MRRRSLVVALLALALPAPSALAHHGKDFLLLSTDDMPAPGHVYALTSADTVIEPDGGRSIEVTPGLLIPAGERIAVEPHLHESRRSGEAWRYDATALDVRYNMGPMPRSEWRSALSVELEKPRDPEEPRNGHVRLIAARTYPNMLFAANLITGRDFVRHGRRDSGFGLGALTPLPNGDRAGLEVVGRIPMADGVEVVPGYYHSHGSTSLKVGVGVFASRAVTTSTFHAAAIRMF